VSSDSCEPTRKNWKKELLGRRFKFLVHVASSASSEDYQARRVEALKAGSIITLKASDSPESKASFLLHQHEKSAEMLRHICS